MSESTLERTAKAATTLFLFTLTACGGGSAGTGAGIVTTTPPVAAPNPTATTVPVPSPPAVTNASADTAEYRATVGAVSMNALAAYNKGATGQGINVAIIDTGIDTSSAEFAGRISTASQNVAGSGGYSDQAGHGTAVSFVLAGRRNDSGTQGVAYDATIIALKADTPGSCSTDGSSCGFKDSALARGIDAAVGAGARVINMSLGSSSAFNSTVLSAIGRATAAGVIIVLSAGNQSDANPDATAQVANNTAISRGLVVVAGSANANDQIADTSNRAGNTAAHYLTAVGQQVTAPGSNGQFFLWSGTSFAAPQISAAVALLAQAFPNLTGKQIVDLLYASARDAGAAGTDAVYGRGVLDLARAFQPIGTSSIASMRSAISFTNNGTMSAPMGDARHEGMGAVILDGFERGFAIDLAGTIRRAQAQPVLYGILSGRAQAATTRARGMTVAMTVAPRGNNVLVERTMLSADRAEGARALAGSVMQRLGNKAGFALGIATGGGALTAQLAGHGEPAFLIARPAGSGFGFDARAGGAAALRVVSGPFGLNAAAETGQVQWRGTSDLAALDGRWRNSPYQRFAIGIDRRAGPLTLTASLSRLNERATILGAHLGDGIGGGRAVSWFGDIGARLDLPNGWSLGGTYRQGRTQARLGGGIDGSGTIVTNAWAADVGKVGVFGASDTMGFRIAQPLRVSRGGLDVTMPTHWDYASRSVTEWTPQRLNLAPTGREMDYEWRYATPLGAGSIAANLFWRRQPGNVAAASDDKGAAVQYAIAF